MAKIQKQRINADKDMEKEANLNIGNEKMELRQFLSC